MGSNILVIIAIIVLGIITYKISFAQISLQNQKIKSDKEEQNILTQKEVILSRVQENILPTADLSLLVVPDTNSSLAALSQVKTLASEKGLILGNINVGSGANDEKSLKTASLNFDVDGSAPAIIDFAGSLSSTAPLMFLDSMSLTTQADVSKATVTVKTYWAVLPTTIPGVNEGVSDLTQEEIDSLKMFATLRLPAFSSLQPQGPTARDNPFN